MNTKKGKRKQKEKDRREGKIRGPPIHIFGYATVGVSQAPRLCKI